MDVKISWKRKCPERKKHVIGEICYWIFNMSIAASVMGLIILLIGKLKFIPRRVSVFLWIIPFVRMLCPLALSSRYSLMTIISRFATKTVTVYKPNNSISVTTANFLQSAVSYTPITYKINVLEKVFIISGIVWLIVTLAILFTLIFMYVITMRAVKDAKHLCQNVYISDKVDSPAVYGIVRPHIVLPGIYTDKDMEYILRHEHTHIRRGDNLWRMIGFLTAAIHWFNPFSWIFLKAFLSDVELSCDEKAIAGYGTEEQKEYARTLLNCSQGKSLFVSAFGGAKVRTRIENILSYKKMTAFSAVGFAVLITLIFYTLITNAG